MYPQLSVPIFCSSASKLPRNKCCILDLMKVFHDRALSSATRRIDRRHWLYMYIIHIYVYIDTEETWGLLGSRVNSVRTIPSPNTFDLRGSLAYPLRRARPLQGNLKVVIKIIGIESLLDSEEKSPDAFASRKHRSWDIVDWVSDQSDEATRHAPSRYWLSLIHSYLPNDACYEKIVRNNSFQNLAICLLQELEAILGTSCEMRNPTSPGTVFIPLQLISITEVLPYPTIHFCITSFCFANRAHADIAIKVSPHFSSIFSTAHTEHPERVCI